MAKTVETDLIAEAPDAVMLNCLPISNNVKSGFDFI